MAARSAANHALSDRPGVCPRSSDFRLRSDDGRLVVPPVYASGHRGRSASRDYVRGADGGVAIWIEREEGRSGFQTAEPFRPPAGVAASELSGPDPGHGAATVVWGRGLCDLPRPVPRIPP